MMIRFMGPCVVSGLIFLWWVLYSRAQIKEKLMQFLCRSRVQVSRGFIGQYDGWIVY